MVGRFKICAKIFTFFDSLAIGGQFVSLKKGIGERAEVFFFEHSFQVGLFIKKRDLRLTEAVAFLTVHSMLHLLGYDHENGGLEAMRMREKEEAVLLQLGLPRTVSYTE